MARRTPRRMVKGKEDRKEKEDRKGKGKGRGA